jgi:hypothetical protein
MAEGAKAGLATLNQSWTEASDPFKPLPKAFRNVGRTC